MPRFVPDHTVAPDLPAAVLDEVDAAWERSERLVAGELELHFDVAVDGRVGGALRDAADGRLVWRLSATEALAIACGDAELALAA
jgi:hypothetical protein